MSNDGIKDEVANVLTVVAGGCSTLATMVPGTAGLVVKIIGAVVACGAQMVLDGDVDVSHIDRVESPDDLLAAMRARWSELANDTGESP